MDYMASMYIDNELDLVEKGTFLENIRAQDDFYYETVALLQQEQLLRQHPEKLFNMVEKKDAFNLKNRIKNLFKPMIYIGTGCALTMIFFVMQLNDMPNSLITTKRFVLFEPDAVKVQLTGTFNDWQKMDMIQVGTTGYWELNIQVPDGEHRFTYILDDHRRIADPTQPHREKDDFGGENSIIDVRVGV